VIQADLLFPLSITKASGSLPGALFLCFCYISDHMDTNSSYPPAYVPSEHESAVYVAWEQSGAFQPHTDKSKPAYTIVMPPLNANGNMHMGHALTMTLEDILVRYHRMKGERALWIPGTDHAGIETQVVFEKHLEKEGRSRFQMTREQFYDEAYAFTTANKKNIEDQVRMMGASCDWSANRFTLDPKVVERVYSTFRRMYDEGLIYRGVRIVNYSVKYQTAYSDIEVEYEERQDPLYFIKYGPITVATVRPEVQFADVAIAVHPEDERYKHLVGSEVAVTFATGEVRALPIIADEFVKPEFGTGAVKISPAHDPNDFEMAQRHNLPLIEVVNRQGKLMDIAGEFAGMKTAEARPKVAAKLAEMGLIEKVDETYTHSVGLCYKSKQPLEPLVMPQWYVKVGPLAEKAINAIEKDEVVFHPENYKQVQLQWLRNLRDWNISRQIVWGIPISGAIPDNAEVASDPDTFDTWFSSGQWPYLVLQALQEEQPERDWTAEFFPTSVMETGRDLVFSWVTRMLMLGIYTMGTVPFKNVYFHGMVLDKHGKKMSKSKGNVVAPTDFVAKYGADATRFGLVLGHAAGSDTPLPEEKIVGGRNFANKLWNIGRFVQQRVEQAGDLPEKGRVITPADDHILHALELATQSITDHLNAYRFSQAAQELHEFVWHELADVYVEAAKHQEDVANTAAVLRDVYMQSLKLLHPVMPFVTESIWSRLTKDQGMLISQSWPIPR